MGYGVVDGALQAVEDNNDSLLAAIKGYGDSQTSVELGACFERKDIPLPK